MKNPIKSWEEKDKIKIFLKEDQGMGRAWRKEFGNEREILNFLHHPPPIPIWNTGVKNKY